MQKTIKRALRNAFHFFGIDPRFYVADRPHELSTLLRLYGAEVVFDIGANAGMSGEYFRNVGFTHKIVSFEPISRLYRELEKKAAGDPLWICENAALGDVDGEQEIYVTGAGGGASSFLVTTGLIEQAAPEFSVVGRELVKIKTLQSAMREYYPDGERLFLKIDAQGYEKKIIESAGSELQRVAGMRIELSLSRSYADEPLICEMLPYLYSLGYRLCAIEEAWSHRETQEVYQVDAIMCRPERRLAHD